MSYQKPQLVAKSEPKQSYVAGCPTGGVGNIPQQCKECERTQ